MTAPVLWNKATKTWELVAGADKNQAIAYLRKLANQGNNTVYRLLEMLVKEVSLVPMAANGYRFLIVKADQGATMPDQPTDAANQAGTKPEQKANLVLNPTTQKALLDHMTPAMQAMAECYKMIEGAQLDESAGAEVPPDLAKTIGTIADHLAKISAGQGEAAPEGEKAPPAEQQQKAAAITTNQQTPAAQTQAAPAAPSAPSVPAPNAAPASSSTQATVPSAPTTPAAPAAPAQPDRFATVMGNLGKPFAAPAQKASVGKGMLITRTSILTKTKPAAPSAPPVDVNTASILQNIQKTLAEHSEILKGKGGNTLPSSNAIQPEGSAPLTDPDDEDQVWGNMASADLADPRNLHPERYR